MSDTSDMAKMTCLIDSLNVKLVEKFNIIFSVISMLCKLFRWSQLYVRCHWSVVRSTGWFMFYKILLFSCHLSKLLQKKCEF